MENVPSLPSPAESALAKRIIRSAQRMVPRGRRGTDAAEFGVPSAAEGIYVGSRTTSPFFPAPTTLLHGPDVRPSARADAGSFSSRFAAVSIRT